jgi:flagellar biosynthesis chaperone FliJ
MAENNVTTKRFENLLRVLEEEFAKVNNRLKKLEDKIDAVDALLQESMQTIVDSHDMLTKQTDALSKISVNLPEMNTVTGQIKTISDTKPIMDLNLRVKHNIEAVKELYNTTSDDFTKKFCNSIMVNGYDTITQKQYKKLLELANNANYNKDLKL